MKLARLRFLLVLALLNVVAGFSAKGDLLYGFSYSYLPGSDIVVVGDPYDLYSSYQWLKEGNNLTDTARVFGAQTNILTINDCQPSDAGIYILKSLDLTSRPQTNIVVGISIYTVNASNFLAGSVFSLGIDTNGLRGGYQWIKDGIYLYDDARFSGSRSNVLSVTNSALGDAGVYVLTTTNPLAPPYNIQTNAVFEVSLYTIPPVLLYSNITYTMTGGDLIFYAPAIGGELYYQWNWQGQPIPGATNSYLDFPSAYATANAGYYSVTITCPSGQVSSPLPGLLFTKTTPGGTYQGIFYNTNSPEVQSSGFMQYTLTGLRASFSGKLVITNHIYPFSGIFAPDHTASVTVPRAKNSPLSLRLQLVTTNEMPQVYGWVSNVNWYADLRGNRLPYSVKKVAPQAGPYSLALANTNPTTFGPDGSCYGAVTIRKDGTVILTGGTADATALSQVRGLAQNGEWALYQSLYGGRGCLVGWVKLSLQSGSSMQGGPVYWLKGPGRDKHYPAGFSVALEPRGSTYVNTPASRPVFSFTNCLAVFSGGDLFDAGIVGDQVKVYLTRPYTLIADRSPENLVLAVNRTYGVMSGYFTDLVTGLRTPLRAVILQQQRTAIGYFLSTNTSGSFVLVPDAWASTHARPASSRLNN